jgi:transcriptional/translational regulatory protein YebC/TACO1
MADEERAEELGLLAIDAGAEDIQIDDGTLEIYTPVDRLQGVKQTIEEEGVTPETSQLAMVPKSTILLENKEAEQTLRLLDVLEDLDDVQKAFTNADFPPEVLDKYQADG